MPSPARILRSCLIDLGLVVMPGETPVPLPDTSVISCFVGGMPSAYDKCVEITDAAGLDDGREMASGRRHMKPGVKILIRHLDDYEGAELAQTIALALDQSIDTMTTRVPEDDADHYVQTVKRTTSVIFLGEEQAANRRYLWSMNARISFQNREGFLG